MKKLMQMKKLMTRLSNRRLCRKYPFLKRYSAWTGKFSGYDSTWYDDISEGWRKAFGPQLLDDLKKALQQDHILHRFRFIQVKEKWGSLCLYHNGTKANSKKVIHKYELMSLGYCELCGAPARYITPGWVTYVCKDCFVKVNKEPITQALKDYRLTMDDIPSSGRNIDGVWTPVDLKAEYGLDFKKMWGIRGKTTEIKKPEI